MSRTTTAGSSRKWRRRAKKATNAFAIHMVLEHRKPSHAIASLTGLRERKVLDLQLEVDATRAAALAAADPDHWKIDA